MARIVSAVIVNTAWKLLPRANFRVGIAPDQAHLHHRKRVWRAGCLCPGFRFARKVRAKRRGGVAQRHDRSARR